MAWILGLVLGGLLGIYIGRRSKNAERDALDSVYISMANEMTALQQENHRLKARKCQCQEHLRQHRKERKL